MQALNSHALSIASTVVGWLYFLAWSASFYPQVFLNWKRKSVVGLSMDYLTYNILGFVCYSVYNCTLFFNPAVQERYEETVGSVIPVEPSDVIFALHAAVLTLIQIGQCFLYDRGSQYVSIPAMVLAAAGWLSMYVSLIVTSVGVISTLSWIYYLSFVKLGVTLVKYCPQAYLNFRRKSTVGWNIWNCLLDLTGGILSFAQQFMDAVNAGTWTVIYGNPVKLGLSLISIAFDLLFIVQHYILYPQAKAPEEKESDYKRIFDEESGQTLLKQGFLTTSSATDTTENSSLYQQQQGQQDGDLTDFDHFAGTERFSSSEDEEWVTATSIQ